MTQLTSNDRPDRSGPGVQLDGGVVLDKVSKAAQGSIPFGRAVVYGDNQNQVRLPNANASHLTFDAIFVTGNNIDLNINAVAIATVPFNTTDQQTWDDLAVAIDAHADIDTAVHESASPSGLAERIVIVAIDKSTDLVVNNIVVSGGASQAAGTATEITADKFFGVSLFDQSKTLEANNAEPVYSDGEALPVVRTGRVNVETLDPVKVGESVAFEFGSASGADRGKFKSGLFSLFFFPWQYSSGEVGTGAEFIIAGDANELVAVTFNQPVTPLASKPVL